MLKEAKELKIERHYEKLHDIAETGFDLYKTTEYVKTALIQMGYGVKECGKCGISADIGKGSKTFLLRADMDALPFGEGSFHACGHDMHTSMLLGAAQLLVNHKQSLNGRVRLMFQPAEEILEGAKDMIQNGVLDCVDAGMMLHVATNVPFKSGAVVLAPSGVSAPSADFFTVTVTGKGCHGSSPWQGRDPILSASFILQTLQNLCYKEITDSMLTIGMFNAGIAPNVIPDKAVLRGTCRCYEESERAKLKSRMESVCESVSSAFETPATLQFDSGCPTLINNSELRNFVKQSVSALLGEDCVIDPSDMPKSGGSEDFAYVSHEIPTVMLALAAGNSNEGYIYPLHHPKVKFDIKALPYGSAVLAQCAMDYLR